METQPASNAANPRWLLLFAPFHALPGNALPARAHAAYNELDNLRAE